MLAGEQETRLEILVLGLINWLIPFCRKLVVDVMFCLLCLEFTF